MSELLAMLTCGAPGFTAIRSTSGDSITANDVAACLTRLDRFTYLYSLEKFSLDGSSRAELDVLAILEGFKQGFKLREGETQLMIAILSLHALRISLTPNKCKKCKGVGEMKLDNKVMRCEACVGEGTRTVSERNLAKILGVTLFQSRKVWKRRFNLLVSKYSERDEMINAAIGIGLRDHKS